jgi:hypothetical protein
MTVLGNMHVNNWPATIPKDHHGTSIVVHSKM